MKKITCWQKVFINKKHLTFPFISLEAMYRYIRQDWKSEYIYGMRKHKKYIANKTKLINSNKISLRHLIGTSRIFVLRDY